MLHHRQFHFVRTVDPVLIRINLLILAFIAFMPFTTNLSGDYSHVPIAVDLFHVNLFIIGTLFLCQWYYLVHNPGITSVEISTTAAANGFSASFGKTLEQPTPPFHSPNINLIVNINVKISSCQYLLWFYHLLLGL